MSKPTLAECLARAKAAAYQRPSLASPQPVDHSGDNPPAVRVIRGRWMAADEWMAEFLRRVSDASTRRYRAALSEVHARPWDGKIAAAAKYDNETEQLLRFIHQQEAA